MKISPLLLALCLIGSAHGFDCDLAVSGTSTVGNPGDCVPISAVVSDCDACTLAAAKFKSMGCSVGEQSCTCFPGDATVTLEGGAQKTMADLAVGDKVLTHGGAYSEVYFFSHRLVDAEATFVEIKTASTTLALTGGHFLYANGKLSEARHVKVGDNVTLASGKPAAVTAIASVRKEGLHNPHTLQGDIVVNGVLTSTYTAAFSPTLAHIVLAPLRAMYRAGVDIFKVDIGAALDMLPAWWTGNFAA